MCWVATNDVRESRPRDSPPVMVDCLPASPIFDESKVTSCGEISDASSSFLHASLELLEAAARTLMCVEQSAADAPPRDHITSSREALRNAADLRPVVLIGVGSTPKR